MSEPDRSCGGSSPGMGGLDSEVDILRAENATLRAEVDRLRKIIGINPETLAETHATAWTPNLFGAETTPDASGVTADSPLGDRLALIRSLFRARADVYAQRWVGRNDRTGWSPVLKGGFAACKSANPSYMPLTDDVLAAHLEGSIAVGIYPLLDADRTGWVAVDFDKGSWALDALAYMDAAAHSGVPVALEVSRSGTGAHVWTFFSQPVPAVDARALAAGLLRRAMDVRGEIDLSSYDRLFPSQDTLPKGGFGNLIALPLQGERAAQGATVFLDPSTMSPWADQWAFLARVARLSPEAVAPLIQAIGPLEAGPSAARRRIRRDTPAPAVLRAALGAMLTVDTAGLPIWMVADLKHLSSLHNPEFHKRQRLRFSTWNTPRLVRCYEEEPGRLHLPRGLVERVRTMLAESGAELDLADQRSEHQRLPIAFRGRLTPAQTAALDRLTAHDNGVLVGATGSGKTVVACAAIAHHQVPTLVLVDRGPLLEQWKQRLSECLDVPEPGIGQIGGGKQRPGGVVDIAMLQTVARREAPHELFDAYGLVVVDECHHLASPSFDAAVRHASTKRWLGLTATPYRSDGLEEIVHFQCGPTRASIARRDTPAALLRPRAVIHDLLTDPRDAAPDEHIQETFRRLVEDEQRNATIVTDIISAVTAGRHCLVLTQWTQHLELLAEGLRAAGLEPLILRGGLTKKARAATMDELAQGAQASTLLLATGSFLGEGFDCPHLDTLFLAFPLRFRGRVEQNLGRVLRASPGKWSVEIHDYVDSLFPKVKAMQAERLTAFERQGIELPPEAGRRRKARVGSAVVVRV